jgi:glycosyltransferase involved in cell wall biosynthesis
MEAPASAAGSPLLSVVVPVFNEVATLDEILRRVLGQPLVGEVCVVDDGSTDGTWERLGAWPGRDGRVRVFRNPVNRGKGSAVRRGLAEAAMPLVLIQDADLEYDPAEYPVLLRPLLEGRADVVFGTRFQGAGPHRVLYFWHYVGNRMLTIISNMLSNLNLTDMECCYKGFRREVIQSLDLEEERFGIEPELVAKLARVRPQLRIYEVPVSYYGRTYEEGKKIGWRDGVHALWCILKYNLWF